MLQLCCVPLNKAWYNYLCTIKQNWAKTLQIWREKNKTTQNIAKKKVLPFGWSGKVGFLINAKCDGNRLSELIMTSWSTRFKRPLKSSLERRKIAADRNIKSLGRWGDCNVLQMHETYSRCHVKIMFPTFFSFNWVLSGALLIVLHHCALFFWKFL